MHKNALNMSMLMPIVNAYTDASCQLLTVMPLLVMAILAFMHGSNNYKDDKLIRSESLRVLQASKQEAMKRHGTT